MSHEHHHHHHHQPTRLNTSFKVAIILNFVFVAVEFVSGYFTDSVGLMSDAGHNLSDVLSLAIAWVGVLVHNRRATLVASYVNTFLLLVAVAVILAESIGKLFHPEAVNGVAMIVVAAVGVVVNLVTTLMLHSNDADINVRGAFLHMLADTLVSVGVVVSGVVILRTGWYIIDPIVGLCVGVIILVMTIGYLRDVVHETKASKKSVVNEIEPDVASN